MLPLLGCVRLGIDRLCLHRIREPNFVAGQHPSGIGILRLGLLTRLRARGVLSDERRLDDSRDARLNRCWPERGHISSIG